MRVSHLVKSLGLALALALMFIVGLRGADGLAQRRGTALAQAAGGAEISVPPVVVTQWSTSGGDQAQVVTGTLLLGGAPVAGAQIAAGGYRLPSLTDAQGRFAFPVDRNVVQRYPVRVTDASQATVGGSMLSAERRKEVTTTVGGINVHYDVTSVTSTLQPDGRVVLSGTVTYANGDPPPPVALYGFRLSGTVRDTAGQPARGMVVTAKEEDRWAVSNVTGPDGHYEAVFWPTPEDNELRVAVYEGNQAYQIQGGGKVALAPLKSSRLDLTVDRASGTLKAAEPQQVEGAIYSGLLVSVMRNGQPAHPLSVTWPDEKGHFSMVLPAELAGQQVAWWQMQTFYFSTVDAKPGGPIDAGEWPAQLGERVAQGFGSLTLAAKK